MKYKYLEPEVTGGFGKETKLDSSTHPPIVEQLAYEFDGWLGDDILETFPCFIVTERLKNAICQRSLSGILFADLSVSKSDTFDALYPERVLPEFYWAKIVGIPKKDDFFIASDSRLVISESAFELLGRFNIHHAVCEQYVD